MSNLKKRILWVDGDIRLAIMYAEEFVEAGFQVDVVTRLDESCDRLQDVSHGYDLLIWELFGLPLGHMGERYVLAAHADDAKDDFHLARIVLRRFRTLYPNAPTILLTTQDQLLSEWCIADQASYAFSKLRCLAVELVEEVKKNSCRQDSLTFHAERFFSSIDATAHLSYNSYKSYFMKKPIPIKKKTGKQPDRGEQLIGSTVLGERGQVVIPKDIRDRLHMRPGAKMMVMQHGDSPIMLLPVEQMQKMIQQMSARVAKLIGSSAGK